LLTLPIVSFPIQYSARNTGMIAERATQICAAIFASAFLVTGVVYLLLGSYPATNEDFWSIYEFYFSHSWWQTAVQKYADHSLFFPNFFWLASVKFFHGSQLPLTLIGLALLFTTAALLLLSVWRDETTGRTMKIMATMVVIVGNFWMGREAITCFGGFNSQNSLTTAAAALCFVLIRGTSRFWLRILIIIGAGFVSSFSCGQGFAIWPTLLLLAWCLRFRWPAIVAIGVGTLVAIITYELLPPLSEDYRVIQAAGSGGITLVAHLCRLISSPVLYAAAGSTGDWRETFVHSKQSSALALWPGAVGLVLAGVIVIRRVVRRDLGKSSLEIAGLGLLVFNVAAVMMIAAGRIQYFHTLPSEVLAPRYLFWSSLFWTGLFLVAIQRAEHLRWGGWLAVVFASAAVIFAWPEHYLMWFHSRVAKCRAEEAATAVINGVVDDNSRFLALDPRQIGRVAPQLRAHRLDMFADGLQDWIGLNETSLFRGRRKPEDLRGKCRVSKLVEYDNGALAARVVGDAITRQHVPPVVRWAITPVSWIVGNEVTKGYVPPARLVIVDPTGVVRGVARSCSLTLVANLVFYQGSFPSTDFVGYIRDYNPQVQYVVRSADDDSLSEETIPVQNEASNEKP
jgi:hypothetical protein